MNRDLFGTDVAASGRCEEGREHARVVEAAGVSRLGVGVEKPVEKARRRRTDPDVAHGRAPPTRRHPEHFSQDVARLLGMVEHREAAGRRESAVGKREVPVLDDRPQAIGPGPREKRGRLVATDRVCRRQTCRDRAFREVAAAGADVEPAGSRRDGTVCQKPLRFFGARPREEPVSSVVARAADVEDIPIFGHAAPPAPG